MATAFRPMGWGTVSLSRSRPRPLASLAARIAGDKTPTPSCASTMLLAISWMRQLGTDSLDEGTSISADGLGKRLPLRRDPGGSLGGSHFRGGGPRRLLEQVRRRRQLAVDLCHILGYDGNRL